MALSSDAALKNPLKGLMLSGMQLLLNAREEELGVEFKIVTKILNRESVFLTLFYTVLCPALGAAFTSHSNLAYRHTSSTRFEHRGPNRTIQTHGTIQKRDAATRADRRGLPRAAQDQETGRRKES